MLLLKCLILNINLKMNIKDHNVLVKVNELIATNRLNRNEILQVVKLLPVSTDISDLKDNLKWETPKSNY